MAASALSAGLQADEFQRLYPAEYFAKFAEQGVRPDGRPLALPRPTSIGLGVVSTADASALVKMGSTTVLAGVKCEIMPALSEAPDEGRWTLQVELAPLCSADARPGRPSEAAGVLSAQLAAVLESGGVLDRRQLCIQAGRAAWALYVDVYVLDADGSLHDACLLAVLAALSSLRLHAVAVDDAGNVTSAAAGGDDRDAQSQRQGTAAAAGNNQPQEQHGRQQPGQQPLTLGCLPVSVTCGVYRGRLLVDPTGEEEPLLEALLTATLDEQGCVLGLTKAGGAAANQQHVVQCLEAAKMRGKEIRGLLRQALDQAAAAVAAS